MKGCVDLIDAGADIEGLRFESNRLQELNGPFGWFDAKLLSSPGPLISDFVTHEKDFAYSNYGIHVGQDDRLTFIGDDRLKIQGSFVDCRRSANRNVVKLEFSPSLERRLIIPRGVAHTFDNLAGIVTRDEPVWYSDESNPDWNVDNDLIAVPRNVCPSAFPVVRINRFRLPDAAHQFMSKLSQAVLHDPKRYLTRYRVKIEGIEQYVMLEPRSWSTGEEYLRTLLDVAVPSGVSISRARYAITGPNSWTIVPSTSGCVSDVLMLSPNIGKTSFVHTRTRMIYTILAPERDLVHIKTLDLRRHSPAFGSTSHVDLCTDPRVVIAIDPGIAYSIACDRPLVIRCEHEIFVANDEPRRELCPFAKDVLVVTEEIESSGVPVPQLRCPDSLVYAMAKHELEHFVEG